MPYITRKKVVSVVHCCNIWLHATFKFITLLVKHYYNVLAALYDVVRQKGLIYY